jgi:hypothetical protein
MAWTDAVGDASTGPWGDDFFPDESSVPESRAGEWAEQEGHVADRAASRWSAEERSAAAAWAAAAWDEEVQRDHRRERHLMWKVALALLVVAAVAVIHVLVG